VNAFEIIFGALARRCFRHAAAIKHGFMNFARLLDDSRPCQRIQMC
jgi:hypothetical protein